MKKMLDEFKDFINKGDVVTIAVGLVMALYFKTIVDKFIEGVITPIIAAIAGEANYEAIGFNIGDARISIGLVIGAIIASTWLANPAPVQVAPQLAAELQGYGITDYSNMIPTQLVSWESLLTLRGFILLVVGGFLVGFGTRYAGGCTSGHAIMGLSDLQVPSLMATISFMVGGFIMANLILPYILAL